MWWVRHFFGLPKVDCRLRAHRLKFWTIMFFSSLQCYQFHIEVFKNHYQLSEKHDSVMHNTAVKFKRHIAAKSDSILWCNMLDSTVENFLYRHIICIFNMCTLWWQLISLTLTYDRCKKNLQIRRIPNAVNHKFKMQFET